MNKTNKTNKTNKRGASDLWFPVVVMCSVFAISIGVWLIKSYYEMKAFNKFSEVPASYCDALFAELRIEANRANASTK